MAVIAVGLSMDAFAVAICKGLSVQKIKPAHMLITGLWFCRPAEIFCFMAKEQ